MNRKQKKRKKENNKTNPNLAHHNSHHHHHLVLAADNSTSGPDDLAHCLCYKATSDGKIIPEDGATGSLCQQLHDGIPEQNFAGDPLYEIYVSHPGTEFEEVHVRLILFFRFASCFLLFADAYWMILTYHNSVDTRISCRTIWGVCLKMDASSLIGLTIVLMERIVVLCTTRPKVRMRTAAAMCD